jgi:hypothetical protein
MRLVIDEVFRSASRAGINEDKMLFIGVPLQSP